MKKFMLFVIVLVCYLIPLVGQAATTGISADEKITITNEIDNFYIEVKVVDQKEIEDGAIELSLILKAAQNTETYNPVIFHTQMSDSILSEIERYKIQHKIILPDNKIFITIKEFWVKEYGSNEFQIISSKSNE
jgi:hypothetical protein